MVFRPGRPADGLRWADCQSTLRLAKGALSPQCAAERISSRHQIQMPAASKTKFCAIFTG